MDVIKKYFSEIWENLPAWFIFFTILITTFQHIAFLKVPRYDFAVTFIFPYLIFLLFYYARYSADSLTDAKKSIRKYLVLAGLTSALLAGAVLTARPVRFAPEWARHFDRVLAGYEISNIFWTALLAIHCFTFRGWKTFLLFFGPAFLYGLVLESSGVTMGYFSEDHYHLYLPGLSAPVATMFGWSTIFYPCVFVLDGLRAAFPAIGRRSFVFQGVLVALVALFFDAFIDPFATNFGLWEWNAIYSPGNSLYWFGVPLVNFVSWFSAVTAFGVFYYFLEMKKASWDQLKRTAAMLALLPCILAAAAAMEFTSLAMIEGLQGPSWTILRNYCASGMPLTRKPERGIKEMDSNPRK
jgi:uncharacterized membrane protein